jgi:hypothetical protein
MLMENLNAIASDPPHAESNEWMVTHPCIVWVLFSTSGKSSDAATDVDLSTTARAFFGSNRSLRQG